MKWTDVEGLSVIAEELEAARVRRVMGDLRRAGEVGFSQGGMTIPEANIIDQATYGRISGVGLNMVRDIVGAIRLLAGVL